MSWEVRGVDELSKDLRKLPEPVRKKAFQVYANLTLGPHLHGSKKLKGYKIPRFRVHLTPQYVVTYEIPEDRTIRVLYTGLREHAYDNPDRLLKTEEWEPIV